MQRLINDICNGRLLFISVCSRRKCSVSYDPFCDVKRALHAHWLFACVCENHERFYDDVCEVGMYVSSYSFLLISDRRRRHAQTIPPVTRVKGRQRYANSGLVPTDFYKCWQLDRQVDGLNRRAKKYRGVIVKILFRISGIESPTTVF